MLVWILEKTDELEATEDVFVTLFNTTEVSYLLSTGYSGVKLFKPNFSGLVYDVRHEINKGMAKMSNNFSTFNHPMRIGIFRRLLDASEFLLPVEEMTLRTESIPIFKLYQMYPNEALVIKLKTYADYFVALEKDRKRKRWAKIRKFQESRKRKAQEIINGTN